MPFVNLTEETFNLLERLYKWSYDTVEAQQAVPLDDFVDHVIKTGLDTLSDKGGSK